MRLPAWIAVGVGAAGTALAAYVVLFGGYDISATDPHLRPTVWLLETTMRNSVRVRAAALEPSSRVRVVATLRADFYDAPLSVPGFGDLLAARTEAITPMSPEELERAIVAPADRAGFVVEPRLLAEMIADNMRRFADGEPLRNIMRTEAGAAQ